MARATGREGDHRACTTVGRKVGEGEAKPFFIHAGADEPQQCIARDVVQ